MTLPADPDAPATVNRMGRQELRPDEQYDGECFADALFDQAAAGNSLFVDCSFAGVSFGALRGTIIDSVQLVTLGPELANHLGITVED